MAERPCTYCRSTIGRLSFFYVNHYDVDDALVKRRLRLCQKCVFDQIASLLESADYFERGQWLPAEWQEQDQWLSAKSGIMDNAPAAKSQSTEPNHTFTTGVTAKEEKQPSSVVNASQSPSPPPAPSSAASKPTTARRGGRTRSKDS